MRKGITYLPFPKPHPNYTQSSFVFVCREGLLSFGQGRLVTRRDWGMSPLCSEFWNCRIGAHFYWCCVWLAAGEFSLCIRVRKRARVRGWRKCFHYRRHVPLKCTSTGTFISSPYFNNKVFLHNRHSEFSLWYLNGSIQNSTYFIKKFIKCVI